MKRILSLILSIALVLSLVPAVHVSAAGEFTIRGTNAAVFPGEQVSVDLMLENNPGFSAINLYYIFDTSYFTLTEVENKVSAFFMTHMTTTVWDAASNFAEDAALATLRFDVDADTPAGEYEVEIMFLSASNDEFEEVFAKTISATIVVQESGCTHASRTEVSAQSADCTHPGNHAYFICNDCGLTFKVDGATETTAEAERIPALGHNLSDTTCTMAATCQRCGYTEASALGHDFVDGLCSRCGIEEPETLLGGSCGDDLEWTLSDDGTLIISGSGAMHDYTNGTQPWYPYADDVRRVVIAAGVESIGEYAFYQFANLTEVSFVYGFREIRRYAFTDCTGLTELTFPGSVTNIAYGALWGASNLITLTFEGDAPPIDRNTVLGVTATVYYPRDNNTWLPAYTRDISTRITWIPYDAPVLWSDSCGNSLRWELVSDGTLKIFGTGEIRSGETKWNAYADCIDKVVLGPGVTAVCSNAFENCINLKEIEFEGNLPRLEEETFRGIDASVYFPRDNETWTADVRKNYGGTLNWIEYVPGAWGSGICGQNLKWTLSKDGILTITGTGAMYDYATISTTLSPDAIKECNYAPWSMYSHGIKAVYVEDGVTTIGNSAFYSVFYNIAEVTLPDTLTRIGECAFHSTSITSIEIPNGVTSIEYMTFGLCDDLRSIDLPDSVTELRNYAFKDCSSLSDIRLSEGLVHIGSYALYGCAPIERLELPAGVAKLGNYVFSDLEELVFTGDAPVFSSKSFSYNTMKVYYPIDKAGWTEDVLQQYGGTVTWIPRSSEGVTIITQPVNYAGAVNDDVTFTVEATGNGLTYQWYFSTDSGATWSKSGSPGNATAILQPILRAYRDGYQFYCMVTDKNGNSVNSNVVSMVVKASEVIITKQPEDEVNAKVNELYAFDVEATGENLVYRWEFSNDGGETWQLSWNGGYNSPNLSVRMNPNRDGYMYRCCITSGLKIVAYSDAVVLNMQDPSAKLISQSGNVYVTANKTATFTVEAEGTDLTYSWQRSDDKGATWTQTFLTGYNTNTLSFTAITSRAVMYICKITDGSGKVIWSSPVKLQILSADLKILKQPVSTSCAAGKTVSFTVEAQGDTLKYQWESSSDGGASWKSSYLGGYNTDTFSFEVNTARAAKLYRCVITDVAGNTVVTDAVYVAIG